MGGKQSKPPPPPAVEHKIKMESPTTINRSSGFHIIELHGPTAGTLVVLVCLLLALAIIMWRTGGWKRLQSKEKRERIARGAVEEMEAQHQPPQRAAVQWSRPRSQRPPPAGPVDPSPELVRLVLPIMSALAARSREEEALRRGGGRFTEVGQHQGRGGQRTHLPSGAMWQADVDGGAPEDEPRSPPARL